MDTSKANESFWFKIYKYNLIAWTLFGGSSIGTIANKLPTKSFLLVLIWRFMMLLIMFFIFYSYYPLKTWYYKKIGKKLNEGHEIKLPSKG